jgi:hypothetical protein
MSEVKVCPPNRALTKGDGEGTYVLIFLIVNFVCSILFYPTTPCVSVAVMTAEILFAILVGIGSPIYLRARAFA